MADESIAALSSERDVLLKLSRDLEDLKVAIDGATTSTSKHAGDDVPPFECSNDCGYMGSYEECDAHEKVCTQEGPISSTRPIKHSGRHPNTLWTHEARTMAETIHSMLKEQGHDCAGDSEDSEYSTIAGTL